MDSSWARERLGGGGFKIRLVKSKKMEYAYEKKPQIQDSNEMKTKDQKDQLRERKEGQRKRE